MITVEKLLSYEKNELVEVAETLQANDIDQLIKWLGEKNDKIRYNSFLLLQHRSETHNDVYRYLDVFLDKLSSSNSYQRSIGFMLTAENTRWDEGNEFDKIIDLYLSFCDDEKPVTVRQCIQSLSKIVPYKKHLCPEIAKKLMSIEIMERKETQRKILLLDILNILIDIRKQAPSSEIEVYIRSAMAGEILDKKAKNEVRKLLES
jgi:hypothetical protein